MSTYEYIDNPTDRFSSASIPEIEIETLTRQIRSHPEYAFPAQLCDTYRSLGLEVIPDPFARNVTDRAARALQTKAPYSVVRMGDAEMNLLSFGACPETPNLDRYAACATIRYNHGSFEQDELWMLALREMMMSAILQADIVGVLGLWRSRPMLDIEKLIANLKTDPRAFSGQWRGMDYMLRIARSGALRHKVVASAHLYFGLIRHLGEILEHAERILLITDRASVLEALRQQYPNHRIQHIPVGSLADIHAQPEEGPRFLQETAAQLPQDLRGCCSLVGAGPWAEIYCSWIKQRGGVGLDIGSGFDLLAGEISRAVHRRLGLQIANPYAL